MEKEEQKEEKEEKPREKEKEEQKPEEQKEEKKTGDNKMPFTIFLFLLITCIIKDAIEIFLGLIPGINLFVWIISIPFAAYIFIIILISGIRGTWLLIGQGLDLIPFASIFPIATLTVILCYIIENLPILKEKMQKAVKAMKSSMPSKIPSEITT